MLTGQCRRVGGVWYRVGSSTSTNGCGFDVCVSDMDLEMLLSKILRSVVRLTMSNFGVTLVLFLQVVYVLAIFFICCFFVRQWCPLSTYPEYFGFGTKLCKVIIAHTELWFGSHGSLVTVVVGEA